MQLLGKIIYMVYWKNYLYGIVLGIIILLIVTALIVWIAIATS